MSEIREDLLEGWLTVSNAVEILGADHVITIEETKEAWSPSPSSQSSESAFIGYRRKTLITYAAFNKINQGDWWGVWFFGFPFRKQYLRMGVDPTRPPYFVMQPLLTANLLSQSDSDDFERNGVCGYRNGFLLINFKPSLAEFPAGPTEVKIRDIEQDFGNRGFGLASMPMVTEAFFSIFSAKKKAVLKEEIGPLSRHISRHSTLKGCLWVGEATADGGITVAEHNGVDTEYGVCTVKLPDFVFSVIR